MVNERETPLPKRIPILPLLRESTTLIRSHSKILAGGVCARRSNDNEGRLNYGGADILPVRTELSDMPVPTKDSQGRITD